MYHCAVRHEATCGMKTLVLAQMNDYDEVAWVAV
jgi:hypothetical protein